MPEGLNTEVAHHLSEQEEEGEEGSSRLRLELIEIVEAILLAAVAIITAWSGYQSALWDGESSKLYGDSSVYHSLASRQTNRSGQELLYNANTFNSWGAATIEGNTKLATFYAKRFTPDYRVAFLAWLKLDPAHNPKAPPGPSYMPQYHNPSAAKAKRLDALSNSTFTKGTEARHTADQYVRSTVLLATILFLVAMGQRFRFKAVRRGLLGVALVLLVFGLFNLVGYPRL